MRYSNLTLQAGLAVLTIIIIVIGLAFLFIGKKNLMMFLNPCRLATVSATHELCCSFAPYHHSGKKGNLPFLNVQVPSVDSVM